MTTPQLQMELLLNASKHASERIISCKSLFQKYHNEIALNPYLYYTFCKTYAQFEIFNNNTKLGMKYLQIALKYIQIIVSNNKEIYWNDICCEICSLLYQ
eukprot:210214_1